ncbi:hypothetical protein [Rubellimicrobium arenae]|uniref:hypothetical protein n=1 Tax=Rubellimicrobium arenae TaxID=2817372 RepID=UPI001B311364|nr:hypothetical protein [Rubellimicrobium arenae]
MPTTAQEVGEIYVNIWDAYPPFLTVQYEGCKVETFGRNSAGIMYVNSDESTAPYDALGVVFSPDGDVTNAYGLSGPGINSILEDRDPFSLSNLLVRGEDRFDQTVALDLPTYGPGQPYNNPPVRPSRLDGFVRLDGEATMIDGRSLLTGHGESKLQYGENGPIWTTAAEVFIDQQLGIVLQGRTSQTGPTGSVVVSGGLPMDFIFPGEPGFMAEKPLIGCHG